MNEAIQMDHRQRPPNIRNMQNSHPFPMPGQPNMAQQMPYGQPPVWHSMQQQQQQQNVAVVITQPGLGQPNRLLLISPYGTREWSSGLCSCCDDMGICCCVYCCACCVEKQITESLHECSCVTCCVPGGSINLRTKLRTIGGIKGSICNDCMAVCCCYLCVLCQMKRELNYMGL